MYTKIDTSSRILEKRQLVERSISRINDKCASAFDLLLNKLLLLSCDPVFASALASRAAADPEETTLCALVKKLNIDSQQDEILQCLLLMLRIDNDNNIFWRFVVEYFCAQRELRAFNTESVTDLDVKMGDVHPSVLPHIEQRLQSIVDSLLNSNIKDMSIQSSQHILHPFFALAEYAAKSNEKNIFYTLLRRSRMMLSLCWLENFEKGRRTACKQYIDEHGIVLCSTVISDELNSHDALIEDSHDGSSIRAKANKRLLEFGIVSEILPDETILHHIPDKIERKLVLPLYVARVASDVEWTMYNRKHFDEDFQPPKIEKSYKIDVYYKDLPSDAKIRFEKLPSAKGWEDEVCFLRIYASSTYADLLFTVRNVPIDTSPHHGYLCELNDRVFSLYFTLKALKYKRI